MDPLKIGPFHTIFKFALSGTKLVQKIVHKFSGSVGYTDFQDAMHANPCQWGQSKVYEMPRPWARGTPLIERALNIATLDRETLNISPQAAP